MSLDGLDTYKLRKSFSKLPSVLEIPHLLEVQVKSYRDFLQADVKQEDLQDIGLHNAFKTVFPIEDYNGKTLLNAM